MNSEAREELSEVGCFAVVVLDIFASIMDGFQVAKDLVTQIGYSYDARNNTQCLRHCRTRSVKLRWRGGRCRLEKWPSTGGARKDYIMKR